MVQKVNCCKCLLTMPQCLGPSLASLPHVQVEGIAISSDGVVSLQWLAEGKDGIYRPTAGIYQEKVHVAVESEQSMGIAFSQPIVCKLHWLQYVPMLALSRLAGH
jgi:hypothetical protein